MANIIGFKGDAQLQPAVDLSQNAGQQYIYRMRQGMNVSLQPGQTFLFPAGEWQVALGRYSSLQWYDTNRALWRSFPTQSASFHIVSSDGSNFRLANTTGCPIGAVITHVGAGNATNGYNTVGVTVSAGNSTWGTLVGGSVNTTVTVNGNANFGAAPIILWTPAANQTIPYIAPQFTACINANGTINTVVCIDQGAGLTAPGTLTAIQQPGDTNPGMPANANIALQANLTNSGNLTALWPLTYGANGNGGLTSVPTFTFNIGGSMAATAIMDFTVTGLTGTANAGGNFGNVQPFTVISANGVANVTANAQVSTSQQDFETWMPRMAWLSSNSNAAGNASNGNVVVIDGGKNLQAIPAMTAIPQNSNVTMGPSAVFTAVVGGVVDTSYIQLL